VKLVDHFQYGLNSPILFDVGADGRVQPPCVHRLSSSVDGIRMS
jgi:hypothetical protein